MDTYKIRVGKNGRITIPIAVRRNLNLRTGDLMIFEHRNGKKVILRKATEDESREHERTGSAKKRKV